MRRVLVLTVVAVILTSGEVAIRAQRVIDKTAPKEDPAANLEEARRAIEARLAQRPLKGVTVTAATEKRVRRILITVPPQNKNPRDDASTALTLAWQAAVPRVKAFDEIAVLVGKGYTVTCGRRAFADPSISLWGDRLSRTCREQRGVTR